MYQKFDQLLIINAGIDAENKKKAIKLIKKSLKEMKNGNFTDEDVQSSINNIINDLRISLDNPTSLISNYYFHNLVQIPFREETIANITKVTKNDVIKLASKINLNTIYLLAPGGNNERN